MNKYLFFLIAAVCSYLMAGVNFAIILSHVFFHKDIRDYGSKNPGFTNFKRVFGGWQAWLVLILDIAKAAVPILIFGLLSEKLFDLRQTGMAWSGLFAVIGHSYPVWYKFKGGKSFIAGVSMIYMLNWRAGIIATIIFLTLLFVTKYMSLASVISTALYPILFIIYSPHEILAEIFLIMACVLIIYRHRENILRLKNGSERKFSLFASKEARE